MDGGGNFSKIKVDVALVAAEVGKSITGKPRYLVQGKRVWVKGVGQLLR
jgi:hypothetical protein